MHEQCLCDGVGKTADQFQSYHQEGGTLLVFSVVMPCLESTAVEQVLVCALVTQRARDRSPSFLGEVFSGFFLICKTNIGKL